MDDICIATFNEKLAERVRFKGVIVKPEPKLFLGLSPWVWKASAALAAVCALALKMQGF